MDLALLRRAGRQIHIGQSAGIVLALALGERKHDHRHKLPLAQQPDQLDVHVSVLRVCSVNFLGIITCIMREKGLYFRQLLDNAGLKASPSLYYISVLLANTPFLLVQSLLTVALGCGFGFATFTNSSWTLITIVFSIFPAFNYARFFLDASTLASGSYEPLTNSYYPGPGFGWADLSVPIPVTSLPAFPDGSKPTFYLPAWALVALALNTLLFFCAALRVEALKPERVYRKRHYASQGEQIAEAELDDIGRHPILRVIGLTKVYEGWSWIQKGRSRTAVEDLDLSIYPGSLLVLLGPNGAGKSTTLGLLSGTITATRGDVRVCGESITGRFTHANAAANRLVALCPQHDALLPELTGRQHVKLAAALRGSLEVRDTTVPAPWWRGWWGTGAAAASSRQAEAVARALAAVDLIGDADSPVATYSGGMKRRLSLAIATVGDPRLLLLDEPTAGLDPAHRREVARYVERLKHGRAVIMTTHHMDEAEALGDTVAVLSGGRLQMHGVARELRRRAALRSDAPPLCVRWKNSRGTADRSLLTACSLDESLEVLEARRTAGALSGDAQGAWSLSRRPSLEVGGNTLFVFEVC
ncbi:hypothetical protein HK405_005241 [Cladochytrium tenue]|nr:hypothetical protein HK405_005241 [Cladochytrium tenue]